MKIASIEKSDNGKHWVVSITESGKVLRTQIVVGTHEEVIVIAETLLNESKAEPTLLID
jgi:hypothetical protein